MPFQTMMGSDEAGSTGYACRPELAIVALLHMMSRFPARRSPAMAESIVSHLRMLAKDAQVAPELRECAERLVDDWRAFGTLAHGSGSGLAS